MLDVGEVADYLHISKSKVYKMVERHEIAAVRIGRAVRIRHADLLHAIELMAR